MPSVTSAPPWMAMGNSIAYCFKLFRTHPPPSQIAPGCGRIFLSKFTKTKHNKRISLWIFVPPKPKCCLIKVNKSNFGAIGVEKHAVEQPNGHLLENRRYLKLPQYMAKIWSNWVRSIWAEPKQGMLCGCSITNLDPQYPTFISTYVKGCYLVNIYFIIKVRVAGVPKFGWIFETLPKW